MSLSIINNQLKLVCKHKAYLYKQIANNKLLDGTIRDYSLHMYYLNELSNVKLSIHAIYKTKDRLKTIEPMCVQFKGYDLSVYTVEELYSHLYNVVGAYKHCRVYPYSKRALVNELIIQDEYVEGIELYITAVNAVV